MTYGFLLESVWHPPLAFAEVAAPSLPSELELQALWFSGAFGRNFRTTRGQQVRILQFGEWNRSAGPDFSRVAIQLEDQFHEGFLELDPDAADWERHGHGANPAFRGTVLHVSFRVSAREAFVRDCDHQEIPQILISENQLADALNLPPRETAIAIPGRCVHPLRKLSESSVGQLLQEAAQHRMTRKVTGWRRCEDAHGRDAALFHATAVTLGYRGNESAMRLLVQRAPLGLLRDRPDDLEAILFGTAGFLSPQLHEAAPDDTRDYLRGLWERWWKCRGDFELPDARAISWKTHGQRPANHPHRRLGALAALVAAWPRYRHLALARPFSSKALLQFLQTLGHPFWDRRHTLTSAESAHKIAVFGKAQALELLANHLGPLASHENGLSWPSFFALRAASPNEKVKRCAIRLFGSLEAASPWLKRLVHHQALLQVYQDFCLEDASGCKDCPFPEQLTQWR